jgi:triacylglycerol lipase
MSAVATLRAPVVLVHGLFGFDQIGFGAVSLRYFPGVAAHLESAGNRVLVPGLSPTGGVQRRARELKRFLNRNAAGQPVHLIAHSLGGLDARCMISRLDMADRVLSLTTISTPHRGTPFADWGIQNAAWLMRPVLRFLMMSNQAFQDLTLESCRRFNDDVPDAAGVRYFSVGSELAGFRPEWSFSHSLVSLAEGPNDGVVSMASARYGEAFDAWTGDHMSLSFWQASPEAPRWAGIVGRLRDLGF